MTLNHFSGIISPKLKTLFTDAITSLLYNDACTSSCTLSYGVTKTESCPNCVYSNIGRKSSNRFLTGGPIPFPNGGICPLCNGAGLRAIESTEEIHLMIIWNYKEFINVGTLNNPNGTIQTLGVKSITPKLKRAKDIIVANNLQGYATHKFVRISEPQPCGLGNEDFVSCLWERIT